MSNGYAYHGMVRITPTDGLVRVFDLRAEFHDARGQSRTRVRYTHQAEDYEDVNKRGRQTKFGIRVEVQLYFSIVSIEDHKALASIVTALMGTATVELSLDAGHTYRAVLMHRNAPSPRPFGRKTLAGAEFRLRLETVELLDTQPVMNKEGGW